MQNAISAIVAARNAQRKNLVAYVKDHPEAAFLLEDDKATCAALTSAATTHSSTLGVSDTVTLAAIAPKD